MTSQTLATVENPIQWTIQYKSSWLASWETADDDLFPVSVQFALAPTITRANIIRHLGETVKLANPVSVTEVVEPLDLSGKFIRITLYTTTVAGDYSERFWYGYCPDIQDNYEGTSNDVTTGATIYNCYGLEWFLRDTRVLTSIGYDYNALAGDRVFNRPLPFNFSNRQRYGKTLGNRSINRNASGIYEFNAAEQAEWTGKDIVEHLLECWNRQTGSIFGFELNAIGGFSVDDLENVKGSWSFEGYNYLTALMEIMGPSNAFSFYVDVNETTSKARINVVPTVSTDLKDEGGNTIVSALPAGYVLDLDSDSRIADGGAKLQYLESNHYDKIEVRGDYLRTAFTMSMSQQVGFEKTLEKGFDYISEVDYNNTDDKERATELLKSVYTRFVVPEDFDGFLDPSDSQRAFPTIDTDTGKVNLTAMQPVFLKNRIFDRVLPWNDFDNESQPRSPFVVYPDSDGYWHYMDRPLNSEDDTIEFTPLGLKMLDDQLGIQIDPGSNLAHVAASESFIGESDVEPEWDFFKLLVTVSMKTDERARVIRTSSTPEAGEVTRTKIIDMPQLAVWFVCPGTVKGIDTSKTGVDGLRKVEDVDGVYTRDDSDKLLRAAILAEELYGKSRQILNLTYAQPYIDENMLGWFVREVQAGQTTKSVDTIISDMTYSFERNAQQLRLNTSFFEFDIRRIMARSGMTGTNMLGNYSGGSVFGGGGMDELANIPVRPPASKVSSSGSPVFTSTYDSDTDEYVISWRDFDVQHCGDYVETSAIRVAQMKTISANEFRFERANVFAQIIIDIHVATLEGEPELYWYIQTDTGTFADAFTASRRMLQTNGLYMIGNQIQRFTRPASYPLFDGSPRQIEYVNDAVWHVANGYNYVPSSGVFTTSFSQYITPGGATNKLPSLTSWTVATSFTDYLIIGWTAATDTFTQDVYANRFTYDDYRIIAFVKTDSSGILRGVIVYGRYTSFEPMGHTGSWNNGTQTVSTTNGRVYLVV